MNFKKLFMASCLVLGTAACNGVTRNDNESHTPPNLLEFDVTDCVDIHDGGVWSWAMIGSEHRAYGIPDTNVSYWFVTLPVLDEPLYPGAHLELRGRFPDARFFAFQNSDDDRSFLDLIADHMIQADPGSVHPFREGIPYPVNGAELNYRIKVKDVPPEQRVRTPDENTLFGGYRPETARRSEYNQIVYRLYAPRGRPAHPGLGDGVTGGVGLPRVVYVVDLDQAGGETPTTKEAICGLFPTYNRLADPYGERFLNITKRADARAPGLAEQPNRPTRGYDPPSPIQFVILDHPFDVLKLAFDIIPDGLLAAPDDPVRSYVNRATRYLVAFLDPAKPDESITVIRFKSPATPQDVIRPETDPVRYWSLCVQQTLNYIYTWACASDRELVHDPDAPGWVTLVFSSAADRPEGLCDPLDPASSGTGCVYNWLSYGSPVPWVFLRYVAASRTGFPESASFYEGDLLDAAAIRTHMGDYYPWSVTCSRESLALDLCGPEHPE